VERATTGPGVSPATETVEAKGGALWIGTPKFVWGTSGGSAAGSYGHNFAQLPGSQSLVTTVGINAIGTGGNRAANSLHTGGVNAALADGSVRFINQNIHWQTLSYLSRIDDGQIVGEW